MAEYEKFNNENINIGDGILLVEAAVRRIANHFGISGNKVWELAQKKSVNQGILMGLTALYNDCFVQKKK